VHAGLVPIRIAQLSSKQPPSSRYVVGVEPLDAKKPFYCGYKFTKIYSSQPPDVDVNLQVTPVLSVELGPDYSH